MGSIHLEGVHKCFGKAHIIQGVDLHIRAREFVVLVGPSGCGKSTLLRLIAGLEEVTVGNVLIDGRDVTTLPPAERGLSMVFQSYALYPHMTVRQNMGFGLKMAGVSKTEIARKVEQGAQTLHLTKLLDRKPKALSGGQRQRVAIGRAIVREPKAFLFDEPLSNLDAGLRVQMRIEIATLHHELQATMVYVTHDQVEAMTLADRIVVLNAGRIEQVGSPLTLYRRPANLFVAQFIGSPKMNILDGVLEHDDGNSVLRFRGRGQVPLDRELEVAHGSPAQLGIRPEHVTLTHDEQGHCEGTVSVVERLGSDTFLYIDIEGQAPVTVRAQGDANVGSGERVSLRFGQNQFHLFDKQGRAIIF